MPFNMQLCLGSHRKRPRNNKKTSKIVKIHTDETTSITLESVGSSVSSIQSFVPSVSLNVTDMSQKEFTSKSSIEYIDEDQTFTLPVSTNDEIGTIPKKVSPPKENVPPLESLESPMDPSINSISSEENKYTLLVSSAVQNSSSGERQNEPLLNEADSNEDSLSPLIKSQADMESSSKTTIAVPLTIVYPEDVKITTDDYPPSESAESMPSIQEKRAEMIEIKMKSPLKVEHVKIDPVKILERDMSEDYPEYDTRDFDIPTENSNTMNITEDDLLNEGFKSENETSNGVFNQKESNLVSFNYPFQEMQQKTFEIAFDTKHSAGDSVPSSTNASFPMNEKLDHIMLPPKADGCEPSCREEFEFSDGSVSEVCEFVELDNPTIWCGDFASSTLEPEKDKKEKPIDHDEMKTKELAWGIEEITAESPDADEKYEFTISETQKEFKNALNSLMDSQNTTDFQSMFNVDERKSENAGVSAYYGNQNVFVFGANDSTEAQRSLKENDFNSEGDILSETKDKQSHSILKDEDLQLLEENQNLMTVDSSVDSDLNEDENCFEFKRKQLLTKKQNGSSKRRVIDQIIESTQNYTTSENDTDNEYVNNKESESKDKSIGDWEHQDPLRETFQEINSIAYNTFVSQNKLKTAIERFIQKAEEYNQMKCNGTLSTSDMNDLADKITQINIDMMSKSDQNDCTDDLIKQLMKTKLGSEVSDSKQNSQTELGESHSNLSTSYSLDALGNVNTLEDDDTETLKSRDDSCSPIKVTFGPNELRASIKPTKNDSSISVKSSNNEFTLNLNHKKGKRSFECIGDFVLVRGDNNDPSEIPPPVTIHLTSKGNGSKRKSSTILSVDSKKKTSDSKCQNLDPKVKEARWKSQETFNRFKKEALKPLGSYRRTVPIKSSDGYQFPLGTHEKNFKEIPIPTGKNEKQHKLHVRVSSDPGRNEEATRKQSDSPRYVYSPTTLRAYRRRNQHDILFGATAGRTSIARRLLEASRALQSPRLDDDQVLFPVDHSRRDHDVVTTPGRYSMQRSDDAKLKHLEILHKRYDVIKNKRDLENIERIEKFIDYSNRQLKSAKRNYADEFGLAFDVKFKRYAKRGHSSGDLISYRRSTDWLTDAGIVGTLLTAEEANRIFKRIAGVKVALNKHDYKRFLFKLTRLKRISYNDIYERLCGCVD